MSLGQNPTVAKTLSGEALIFFLRKAYQEHKPSFQSLKFYLKTKENKIHKKNKEIQISLVRHEKVKESHTKISSCHMSLGYWFFFKS